MHNEQMLRLEEIAHSHGYTNLRWVGEALCGILPFLYTHGVCYRLDESGYRMRFCFETKLQAVSFLETWDGKTLPIVGQDGCTAIK